MQSNHFNLKMLLCELVEVILQMPHAPRLPSHLGYTIVFVCEGLRERYIMGIARPCNVGKIKSSSFIENGNLSQLQLLGGTTVTFLN